MSFIQNRLLERQRIAQLEVHLEKYADFYKLWRELQRLKSRGAPREELEVAAQNLVEAANVLEGQLEVGVTWGMPRPVDG